jgi:hypothetical protein
MSELLSLIVLTFLLVVLGSSVYALIVLRRMKKRLEKMLEKEAQP